jgi:F-type H+-transporting ATPase subunit beta
LSEQDRHIVLRARKLQRYLPQPFWVTAEHTGIAGVSVPLAQTLEDCDSIMAGRVDNWPEERFYMRGGLGAAA